MCQYFAGSNSIPSITLAYFIHSIYCKGLNNDPVALKGPVYIYTRYSFCCSYVMVQVSIAKNVAKTVACMGALTANGFQIILYHRYDSCNYARFGWVRFV